MKVGIVLNGDAPSAAERDLLRTCDAIVCADGGAAAVLAADLTPTLIVGDFDSLAPELAAQAAQRGARLVRLPAAKDETDGERAVLAALEMRPRACLVLGAHGGRSALFLANLALLAKVRSAGASGVMVGQGERIVPLAAGDRFSLGPWRGSTFNVVPQGSGCTITLAGTSWPLDAARLDIGSTRGASNRIAAADAHAVLHDGTCLLVIETAPPGQGWLRPPDAEGVAYEFYAPFAHVPGKYEWCRIRSATHGAFDCFILLGASTSDAATVYVSSDAGARFMRERFPACAAHRLPTFDLGLREEDDGCTVVGLLRADAGPVREVDLRFTAARDASPVQARYGGDGLPVWGSAWTCWGVDLSVPAKVTGHVRFADGRRDALREVPASIALGSFGRLAPRPPPP